MLWVAYGFEIWLTGVSPVLRAAAMRFYAVAQFVKGRRQRTAPNL